MINPELNISKQQSLLVHFRCKNTKIISDILIPATILPSPHLPQNCLVYFIHWPETSKKFLVFAYYFNLYLRIAHINAGIRIQPDKSTDWIFPSSSKETPARFFVTKIAPLTTSS